MKIVNASEVGKEFKLKAKRALWKRSCSLLLSVFSLYFISLISLRSALASDGIKEHCRNVRNDDMVRQIPGELLNDARKLYGSASDDKYLIAMTVYRCMNGRVRLCNAGANIICAKPDKRRGSPEITKYCKENPNNEGVPFAVAGHGTLYEWKCVESKPVIDFTREMDARGFIEDVWTPID